MPSFIFSDGKFRTDHEAKQKLQRCSEIIEDICAQATGLSKSTILAKFAQFATGHETPANIVANAILFCGLRPSENTSLNAILTEAIRIDPPIQRLWRTACREFSVEGIPIPNGASLLIDLGLASRDEAYFQKADCFRACGELGFGHGPRDGFSCLEQEKTYVPWSLHSLKRALTRFKGRKSAAFGQGYGENRPFRRRESFQGDKPLRRFRF